MGNFVTSTPNEAVLISGVRGTRVAVGSTTWRWWVVDRVERLTLELIQLELKSVDAETVHGVKVTVTSVANVKVKAKLLDAGDRMKIDKETILIAAQQFGGKTPQEINSMLKMALEGHQRQVLGTLTVEQLFRDRASFSGKVREHVHEDLERMGFEIISYTIKEISDHNGYMDALGATQTSIVKREAAEGEAKNASEAQQKVAQAQSNAKVFAAKANREAHVSANQQQEQEVESNKNLELRKAEQALLVGEAKQKADAALKGQLKVMETNIALQEAKRMEVEAQGQAKARIVQAEAEAEKIRILAKAEADAIRMKGEAEAANLRLQAEAYNAFGEAALSHMLIGKLPEIAAEIAKPLSKADKITFVSSGGEGGGPSALTRDVTTILSQLPSSIQAMTGFDLRAAIQNSGTGSTTASAAASASNAAARRRESIQNRNAEEQVL